jgi:hypothetical protein
LTGKISSREWMHNAVEIEDRCSSRKLERGKDPALRRTHKGVNVENKESDTMKPTMRAINSL